MTVINWSPLYQTGIAAIDEQHQMLVNLINQLAPLLASDCSAASECVDLLDALFKYMSAHCVLEEQLMQEQGVSEQHLKQHRLAHRCFEQHLSSLRQLFEQGQPDSGGDLLRFLIGWVNFHVLGQDQQMVYELKAAQAGASPETLWLTALQEQEGQLGVFHNRLIGALVDLFEQMTKQSQQLVETRLQLRNLQEELNVSRTHFQAEVTERTLELQRAKDAAETASQAKSRFLGIISHELLTPLNAIQGFAHLLEQAEIPPKQRQHAKRIVRSAEHLHELLNEILQFSRLETGEVDSQRCSFSPASLLKQVAEQINRAAIEKQVEVSTYHDPGLPRLLGDVRLLRQALEILANNAVKFTEEGRINLTAYQLDAPDQRLLVAFEVQDTGIGIPLERQNQLFQAFSQLDSSKTRKHDGIGLGLVICSRLVELLGGNLTVKSTPGVGSSFRITLMLERAITVRYPSHGKPQQPIGQSLHQLIELLKQDNMEARRLYYCVQPSLFETDPENTNRLSEQVQNYEFQQALTTLQEIIDQNAEQLNL